MFTFPFVNVYHISLIRVSNGMILIYSAIMVNVATQPVSLLTHKIMHCMQMRQSEGYRYDLLLSSCHQAHTRRVCSATINNHKPNASSSKIINNIKRTIITKVPIIQTN